MNAIGQSSSTVCKFCQSTNTRKYGKYKATQLYFCDDCQRKFIPIKRLRWLIIECPELCNRPIVEVAGMLEVKA